MIGIITAGGGNIRSLSNALEFLGQKHDIVSDERPLETFDAIIIPGVGHFRSAIDGLQRHDYCERIREFHATGKKIVGICLGFQLLFESSDEAPGYSGLSLLQGHSAAFNLTDDLASMNVGWRNIFSNNQQQQFEPYRSKKFYFMHCYRVARRKNDVNVAWSEYGGDEFLSAIWHENVRAFQFHPEKSGVSGLNLLRDALVD